MFHFLSFSVQRACTHTHTHTMPQSVCPPCDIHLPGSDIEQNGLDVDMFPYLGTADIYCAFFVPLLSKTKAKNRTIGCVIHSIYYVSWCGDARQCDEQMSVGFFCFIQIEMQ